MLIRNRFLYKLRCRSIFLKGWIRIWSGSVKSQPRFAILVYKLRKTKRYLRLTGLYRYSNYLPAEDDFADTSSAPVSFNVKREDSAAPFFVTVDGQVKLYLVYSWVHRFKICEKKIQKKHLKMSNKTPLYKDEYEKFVIQNMPIALNIIWFFSLL